jgi:peptidoglycan hydrolase CwlO-like protein
LLENNHVGPAFLALFHKNPLTRSKENTMRQQPIFSLQPLECRTFLAAHVGGVWRDPTIVADRAVIIADYKDLNADKRSGRAAIIADQKALNAELEKLRANTPDLEAQLKPVKDQLKADEKARRNELVADAKAIRNAELAAAPTIRADKRQLFADIRSGNQAKIDASKKKLADDRAALASTLKPLLAELKADTSKWRTKLQADRNAIQAKLEQLDPALKPLYDKLAADTASFNKTIAEDLAKLKTDLAKLEADIKAYRAAHKPATA